MLERSARLVAIVALAGPLLAAGCQEAGPTDPGVNEPGPSLQQTGPGGQVDGLRARSVHPAENFTCALTPAGEAYCWGDDRVGQLGNGGSGSSLEPVPVAGGHRFVQLSTGTQTACGLTGAGEVYCWGSKRIRPDLVSFEPRKVESPVAFRSIDVALRGGCGLARDGSAWCWFSNVFGRFGNGERQGFHAMPVPVDGSLRFQELSLSVTHACGLATGGEAWCWGDNFFGELGADPETFRQGCGFPNDCFPEPVKVETDLRFRDLKAGAGFTCGLASGGSLWCWGLGQTGQRGDGSDQATTRTPRRVVGVQRFRSFDPSDGNHVFEHACGLTPDGTAWCWGYSAFGQLGAPGDETCETGAFGAPRSVPCSTDPVEVSTDLAFRSIATGAFHTCGIARDGRVWCWGDNRDGELGDGTTDSSVEPVLVGGGTADSRAGAAARTSGQSRPSVPRILEDLTGGR